MCNAGYFVRAVYLPHNYCTSNREKSPTFPYRCLSGGTNNYTFQFSTYCCVHPKDLHSGHVFIGCTDLFGLDAALCVKKHFVFWCPDGGSRRFYNRVHRKRSSSKQPHCVLERKSCLRHRTVIYFVLSTQTRPKWHMLIYTHQVNNCESWTTQEAPVEVNCCLKHTEISLCEVFLWRKEDASSMGRALQIGNPRMCSLCSADPFRQQNPPDSNSLHEHFTMYVKTFTLPLLAERWVLHPWWSEDVCRWKQLGTHRTVVGGSSKPELLWTCSTKCALSQCPWLHRSLPQLAAVRMKPFFPLHLLALSSGTVSNLTDLTPCTVSHWEQEVAGSAPWPGWVPAAAQPVPGCGGDLESWHATGRAMGVSVMQSWWYKHICDTIENGLKGQKKQESTGKTCHKGTQVGRCVVAASAVLSFIKSVYHIAAVLTRGDSRDT